MSEPLTLLQSAELLGRYRYVELLLFERLGERAPRAQRAEAAVYLSGAARAHAFRAGLLEQRLPVSAGLPDAARLTVSPDSRIDAAIRTLAGSDDDDAILAGLLRVLYPSMLASYRQHIEACSALADPPIRRCLLRVTSDLELLIEEGELLAPELSGDSAWLGPWLSDLGGPFGRWEISN